MGCDIHLVAQRKVDGAWEYVNMNPHAFDWRSYSVFGFLADVRNYSAVPPIAAQRGLPEDFVIGEDEEGWLGDHSFSWLSIEELLAFNYDAEFEDRRVTRQIAPNAWSGGVTVAPGEGANTTFREFLGSAFFDDLERLKRSGAERIVFGFDS